MEGRVCAMAIYVDNARKKTRIGQYGNYIVSHMTADSRQELHEFAEDLEVTFGFFRPDPPHYEITEMRRKQALKKGAIDVSTQELFEIAKTLGEIS